MLDIDARKHTQLQWNTNPCGELEGDKTKLEYFLKVEEERYKQQNWQHEYFDFNGFAGKKVLEIGIGHGTDLLQFAKGGADCYGVDITDKHFELTQRNFDLRGYKVTLKRSDATNIDYPDNYFDCVYSFGVLHHIPEIDKCISEISRILKPGGTFYVSLYYKYSAFHLFAKILIDGLLKGKLFTLGYNGLLATIEKGADGKKIKPYVRLYTKKSLRNLFSNNWNILDPSIYQLELGHFLPGKEKLFGNKIINFFHRKKHKYGWYVTGIAKKKYE